jgi:hypothetical protein
MTPTSRIVSQSYRTLLFYNTSTLHRRYSLPAKMAPSGLTGAIMASGERMNDAVRTVDVRRARRVGTVIAVDNPRDLHDPLVSSPNNNLRHARRRGIGVVRVYSWHALVPWNMREACAHGRCDSLLIGRALYLVLRVTHPQHNPIALVPSLREILLFNFSREPRSCFLMFQGNREIGACSRPAILRFYDSKIRILCHQSAEIGAG